MDRLLLVAGACLAAQLQPLVRGFAKDAPTPQGAPKQDNRSPMADADGGAIKYPFPDNYTASTLEWIIPHPPPYHHFPQLPVIRVTPLRPGQSAPGHH